MAIIDYKRAIIDHEGTINEIESGHAKDTFFKTNGYYKKSYSENLNKKLLLCFEDKLISPYEQMDFSSDFDPAIEKGDDEKIKKMNDQYIFYKPPSPTSEGFKGLKDFFQGIYPTIENEIGSSFEVINIRAWKTKPTSNYGPTKMHRDGGSFFIRKIMIYPFGLNKENGGLEFISLKKEKVSFEIKEPSWILINSSQLLHRGIPPKKVNFLRPAIEITIKNSLVNILDLKFSGQNARFPKTNLSHLPESIPYEILEKNKFSKTKKLSANRIKLIINLLISGKIYGVIYKKLKTKIVSKIQNNNNQFIIPELYVNLGAGRITHSEFRNLDVVKSKTNPYPFIFSKDSIFPISTSSVPLVYTSHFIEHINDETVANILKESKRILKKDGNLLIKIPDFDMYLNAFKSGDKSKFNLQNVEWSWKNKNVPVIWENIALMWFCGFWNKEYGSHFLQKIEKNNTSAYHGPPVSAYKNINKILEMDSPHEISSFLRKIVTSEENNYTFNHQNSWSKKELETILKDNNFKEISFDKKKIASDYSFVPKIRELYETSIYCIAKK